MWGIGKSYQADVYRLEKGMDRERVKREVSEIYRERLFRLHDDGMLEPVDR